MKLLAKLLSLILIIFIIIITLGTIIDNNTLIDFTEKIGEFLKDNLIPLITISLAGMGLIKEEKITILRSIVTYMVLTMFYKIVLIFFEFDTNTQQNLVNIYNILATFHSIMLIYTLIKIIDISNSISNLFKKITYSIVFVNIFSQIYIIIIEWIEKNTRNYLDIKFGTINYGSFIYRIFSLSLILTFLSIVIMYITNYAFTAKDIIDEGNIDLDDLKLKATIRNEEKIKTIYNNNPEKKIEYEKADTVININNQLGHGANVGVVKEQAKEVKVINTSLDSVFNMSSRPVVNESIKTDSDDNNNV